MRLFLLIAHDKPEDGAIVGSKALLSQFRAVSCCFIFCLIVIVMIVQSFVCDVLQPFVVVL